MAVNTEIKGLYETDCALRRLTDELRRVRTVAIFLAKGVMKMQRARLEAIAQDPEACKHYMTWEFPVLQGPKAESIISRFAQLEDGAAERAESKYLGPASNRDNEGWIPVTSRYPGAQPYTWSRSVLVLLDTGGITISSYFDRQNLEGQWLNLEEGFGTVTHWHELPPLPDSEEQKAVLETLERSGKLKTPAKPQGASRRSRSQRRAQSVADLDAYSSGSWHRSPRQSPGTAPAETSQPQPTVQQPAAPFRGNEKLAPVRDDEIRWI